MGHHTVLDGGKMKTMRRLRSHALAATAGLVMANTMLLGLGSTSDATVSKAPLTIGVICSCTGPLASSVAVGPPAFEAWAQWENANGGLNGHQINVVENDDQDNSGTAITDVTKMVVNDHISILVDDSSVDTAFAHYIDSEHIPVIGGGSQSDLLITDPNFFAPGQTTDDAFVNYMEAAKKVGATTIAQLYCAESPICQQGVAPFKAAAKAEGIKVGYVSQISFAAPSYAAQCLAAKQAGVDIMNVADAVFVAEKVAANCVAQGYEPWQLTLDGAVALSFLTAPGIKDKFIGSEPDMPFFVTSTPAMKTYDTALKEYAAAQTINSPNYNEESTQNWITGLLIAAAAKASDAGKSGAITTSEVYKGLYALHNETLGGMTSPLNFKKGQPNPVHCWFWISIHNGKFTTPYGLKPDCVAPPKK